MNVDCKQIEEGIRLKIKDESFELKFPDKVWKEFPDALKGAYVDNYSYVKALHLPQMLNNGNALDFKTSYPAFKSKLYAALMKNIPYCADVDGVSTQKNIQRFLDIKQTFASYEPKYPRYDEKLGEKAIISMSFGKDSLLTYALSLELGLEPELIMSMDNDCPVENRYKLEIADRFSKVYGKKIWKIHNETCMIHLPKHWDVHETEWGFGHLITEYCMNMIPFAHYFKAKYIMLGNEKSCNLYYINKEGYKSYPVYDQTAEWMLELNSMAGALTDRQMRVASLIEPLNDLAIIKILHGRYPKIAKYQMSCFPDDNKYGEKHFWCGHCTKCARIFIFMHANGFDPKSVGLDTDMLEEEFAQYFSLFGVSKDTAMAYDNSGLGRDEQLYAFYLASKRGVKGKLIDIFDEKYYKEAEKREKELHDEFYGIHDSVTIPKGLKEALYSIFKEELA